MCVSRLESLVEDVKENFGAMVVRLNCRGYYSELGPVKAMVRRLGDNGPPYLHVEVEISLSELDAEAMKIMGQHFEDIEVIADIHFMKCDGAYFEKYVEGRSLVLRFCFSPDYETDDPAVLEMEHELEQRIGQEIKITGEKYEETETEEIVQSLKVVLLSSLYRTVKRDDVKKLEYHLASNDTIYTAIYDILVELTASIKRIGVVTDNIINIVEEKLKIIEKTLTEEKDPQLKISDFSAEKVLNNLKQYLKDKNLLVIRNPETIVKEYMKKVKNRNTESQT